MHESNPPYFSLPILVGRPLYASKAFGIAPRIRARRTHSSRVERVPHMQATALPAVVGRRSPTALRTANPVIALSVRSKTNRKRRHPRRIRRRKRLGSEASASTQRRNSEGRMTHRSPVLRRTPSRSHSGAAAAPATTAAAAAPATTAAASPAAAATPATAAAASPAAAATPATAAAASPTATAARGRTGKPGLTPTVLGPCSARKVSPTSCQTLEKLIAVRIVGRAVLIIERNGAPCPPRGWQTPPTQWSDMTQLSSLHGWPVASAGAHIHPVV